MGQEQRQEQQIQGQKRERQKQERFDLWECQQILRKGKRTFGELAMMINSRRRVQGRGEVHPQTVRLKHRQLLMALPYADERDDGPPPLVGRCSGCFRTAAIAALVGRQRFCERCEARRTAVQEGRQDG